MDSREKQVVLIKPKKRKRARNPLKMDPTRTATLRRAFAASIKRKFARLRFELRKLLIEEDAFGLVEKKRFVIGNSARVTANDQQWRFRSSPEKIKAFQDWLRQQLGSIVIGKSNEQLWQLYIEQGFRRGAGRAFDDTKKTERALAIGAERLDFFNGTRDQFLRTSFGQPIAVEKVKLLAGRSFDDLENVTVDMSARMSRHLTDGLVQGKGPREIARTMDKDLDIGSTRALTIARTELIRAHAEGQLTALENLGVEEVGVSVEWSTAGDDKVCPICEELQGVVLKLDEARGMLPRHPNCRCAWIPANVGETSDKQKDTKSTISDSIRESQKLAGDDEDGWGPGQAISRDRPESILNQALIDFSRYINNVFCATGKGGGVDPSCSPGGSEKILSPLEYIRAKAKGELPEQIAAEKARAAKAAAQPVLKTSASDINKGKVIEKLLPHVRASANDPDPHKTAKFDLKPHKAQVEKIKEMLKVHEATRSFKRLNISDIAAKIPELSIATLHGILGKMHHEGTIRLGPYTQALPTHEKPEHLLPLEREAKYYISLGKPIANVFCATGEGDPEETIRITND